MARYVESGGWIAEYDEVANAYTAGAIDLPEFRSRLRRLGFEPPEIDDHANALEEPHADR